MRNLYTFLFLAFLVLIGCSDETQVFQDAVTSMDVITNEVELQSSVNFDKSGVLDLNNWELATQKNTQAGNYPLTLVAQIQPPAYQGVQQMTATHVDIHDDLIYVSYNTPDAVYQGAIDIINIANPESPVVQSRVYFTNADVSALAYHNNYVFAVGGVDAEQSDLAPTNSFVARLPISNGRFSLGSGVKFGFQEGFVATDIGINSQGIWVSSGQDGSLTRYNEELETQDEASFQDLRSLAIRDGQIATLDGSYGIRLLNSNMETQVEIPVNLDFGLAEKRSISFAEDKVALAEGRSGSSLYNLVTREQEATISIPVNPEGVDGGDQVTNAAALNQELWLMANGGAGLALIDRERQNEFLGVVELEGSINYVASQGDYIFAASGKEGLQIIKLNRVLDFNSLCENAVNYSGPNNMIIASGTSEAYRGSKSLRSMTVNGDVQLCGNYTVRNEVNLNENSSVDMQGRLYVGRNNRRQNLRLKAGVTLRISGGLVVYGDLILDPGARIEFLESNFNYAAIRGNVQMAEGASVQGEFRDIWNKF